MMTRTKGPIPPVILLLSILCQFGLHSWLPVARLIGPPWHNVGFVLIVLGVLIVVGPIAAFSRAATTIKPFQDSSSLVATGMYRYTRNPMYVGMVLVLLGIAVRLGDLTPFVMPILFVPILTARVIKHEEVMLEERFGDEYREFKQSVPRWLW